MGDNTSDIRASSEGFRILSSCFVKFILGFLLLFISVIGFTQKAKTNDLLIENLNGKVQVVTAQMLQSRIEDSIQKSDVVNLSYRIRFNEAGYKTEEADSDATGRFNSITYKYNKQNRLILKTEFKSALKFSITDKYNYGKSGNITSRKQYMGDTSLISFTEYLYNSKNQLVKVLDRYGLGEGGATIYVYDGRDSLIKKEDYNSAGEKVGTNSYRYDVKGNLIELLHLSGDSSSYLLRSYRYDNSNHIKELSIEGNYENDVNLYFYDTKDRKTKIESFDHHVLMQIDSFEYNPNGLQIRQLVYENNLSLYSETLFTYDKMNNWISQIVVYADGTKTIRRRKITYY